MAFAQTLQFLGTIPAICPLHFVNIFPFSDTLCLGTLEWRSRFHYGIDPIQIVWSWITLSTYLRTSVRTKLVAIVLLVCREEEFRSIFFRMFSNDFSNVLLNFFVGVLRPSLANMYFFLNGTCVYMNLFFQSHDRIDQIFELFFNTFYYLLEVLKFCACAWDAFVISFNDVFENLPYTKSDFFYSYVIEHFPFRSTFMYVILVQKIVALGVFNFKIFTFIYS